MDVIDTAEHGVAAIFRDGALVEIWCLCGWISRGGFVDECVHYLERHAEHAWM
jgi:hypothetical protein